MQRNVFSAFNPSLVMKEQWAAVMRPEATGGSVPCSRTLQLANGESGDRTDNLGVAG